MNQERRIKREISEIMTGMTHIERAHFIENIDAFLYTENRRISDSEQEALLKEKNQHVYSVVKVY